MTNTCVHCDTDMLPAHVKVTDSNGHSIWVFCWLCACEHDEEEYVH